MKVLALPYTVRALVFVCVLAQLLTLYLVATNPGLTWWMGLLAFFVGGFVTDWISGLAHFGFDYIWPPNMPILGPISVDFRGHHERPGLDPSAILANLTIGAYGAFPVTCAAIAISVMSDSGSYALLVACLFSVSVWMLGFHQIHSYAHMGCKLPAVEFNSAVERIVQLPTKREQKAEFKKLFAELGIPKPVQFMQKCRLFLRPEVHWRHHFEFESDFSSVNGWSDPLMNLVYRPAVRALKARQERLNQRIKVETQEVVSN